LAKQRKILGDVYKGEKIAGAQVMPGLGERWGRPLAQQHAIKIPGDKLMDMTRKIVRGRTYLDDNTFIEPPCEIECYLPDEEGVKDVKDLLAKYGKEYKREPGLAICRARVEEDPLTALYEITFWDQFKTYTTISKHPYRLSKLVDELSRLSIVEMAELAKMLEERYGISVAGSCGRSGAGYGF
jgi:hypothetical protein